MTPNLVKWVQTYCVVRLSQDAKFNAAGPESLEDYFQKGALLGQKAALNLSAIFGLYNFFFLLFLVIFYIHIIQSSFFSSEY